MCTASSIFGNVMSVMMPMYRQRSRSPRLPTTSDRDGVPVPAATLTAVDGVAGGADTGARYRPFQNGCNATTTKRAGEKKNKEGKTTQKLCQLVGATVVTEHLPILRDAFRHR